jgi:photosystem II stability/assembly factor-like uncharacterized protein
MKKKLYGLIIIALSLALSLFSCEPRNIVEAEVTPVPYGVRLFSPNWEQAENLDGYEVAALEQSFNSYIIAATSSGNLFRSKSDGDNWILAPAGNNPVTTVYRANVDFIFAGSDDGKLYYSNTNGRIWELLKSFTQTITSIVAAKNNSIILGTSSGLYISTDNVETWNLVTNGISPSLRIYSLITLRDGTVLAGTIDGLYRSTDNGLTWSQSELNETCYTFSQSYNSALFAGTQNGVFRSDDMGKTWFNTGLKEERIISIKVIRETHVFAGTNGKGIFYSHNNGYNWTYFGFDNQRIKSILDLGHLDMVIASAGNKVYRITAKK